jgi:hypothetical protein
MPRSFSLRPELEEMDEEDRMPESCVAEFAPSGSVESLGDAVPSAGRGVSRRLRRGDRDGDDAVEKLAFWTISAGKCQQVDLNCDIGSLTRE